MRWPLKVSAEYRNSSTASARWLWRCLAGGGGAGNDHASFGDHALAHRRHGWIVRAGMDRAAIGQRSPAPRIDEAANLGKHRLQGQILRSRGREPGQIGRQFGRIERCRGCQILRQSKTLAIYIALIGLMRGEPTAADIRGIADQAVAEQKIAVEMFHVG